MHCLKNKVLKAFCAVAVTITAACSGASGLYLADVTASSVNLRTEANGSIITSLPQGTTVAVIDNNSSWYRVAVNGATGYLYGQYVCGTSDGDAALGNGVITCNSSVNVRSDPSTDGGVAGTLSNGSAVTVLGVYNDFYKIQCGNLSGYVYYPYVYINTYSGLSSRGSNSSSQALREEVIDYASTFLGTPYVYGGSTPSGFDCSGFTSYVYQNTVRSIPRTAASQYSGMTHVSSISSLQPADLVFFSSGGGAITHVGLYVGDGEFIHSPHTGSYVKYDSLSNSYYKSHFVSGGRVIFD